MLRRIDVGKSSQYAHKLKNEKKSHYRPTAMAIITKGDEVLFVLSAKSETWGPVKGGIHKSESLKQAIWREVKEEIGLKPEDFEDYFRYLGSAKDKGFADRAKSRGFAVGKHHHVVHLKLKNKKQKFQLEEGKVADAKFVGDRQSFMRMPMKVRRRRILAYALIQIGVAWATTS